MLPFHPFGPILLEFGGRSHQISPLHLTLQDAETPKESYRIRDWRLKVFDQLTQQHPDLRKGGLLKQLDKGSKVVLEMIKMAHETLAEWQRAGHPDEEIQDLKQKIEYFLSIFTRTMMGTPQRTYVCWEVKTSQSIKAFCVIMGIENSWTGRIPRLETAAQPERPDKRQPPANIEGEANSKRKFRATREDPPQPLLSPSQVLVDDDEIFGIFSDLPALSLPRYQEEPSPEEERPLSPFDPDALILSRPPSPEPALQDPAPVPIPQDPTPSPTLAEPAPSPRLTSLEGEIAALVADLRGSVSAAELGHLSESWAQLSSNWQSVRELRQLLGQSFLQQVREQPEAFSASWGHPELVNDPHYAETDAQSGAVALKSLIPETLLPPSTRLPVDAYAMLLFLLQDEIPAIADQLARDQAQMDKPHSQDMISVLVPKTTKQTSAMGKSWYRLLLSSPILGMNRLMENMVVGLNDPAHAFEQGLQRTLAALQPLQETSGAQARLQESVERLVAKEKGDWSTRVAELTQEHEALKQRFSQLQRDFVELGEQFNKDRAGLQEENEELKKENEIFRTRWAETPDPNRTPDWKESYFQQSRVIRNIQAELDKLRDMHTRERLSGPLPGGGLEFGDDF